MVGYLPLFRLFCLSFSFYNDFSIAPQVVDEVQNLMRQRTHIFHRLETTETMRAYVAHNMDGNEDVLANLKTMKSEVVAAQELAKEGVNFSRKVGLEKDAS